MFVFAWKTRSLSNCTFVDKLCMTNAHNWYHSCSSDWRPAMLLVMRVRRQVVMKMVSLRSSQYAKACCLSFVWCHFWTRWCPCEWYVEDFVLECDTHIILADFVLQLPTFAAVCYCYFCGWKDMLSVKSAAACPPGLDRLKNCKW